MNNVSLLIDCIMITTVTLELNILFAILLEISPYNYFIISARRLETINIHDHVWWL